MGLSGLRMPCFLLWWTYHIATIAKAMCSDAQQWGDQHRLLNDVTLQDLPMALPLPTIAGFSEREGIVLCNYFVTRCI
ncbi:hypothetical protein HD806DRAFT_533989 [Xylariaceae sp. AK1471]|nr:hypothetical protein HD806DRAFT_533989 [Xylariaceae sp. AK1471]